MLTERRIATLQQKDQNNTAPLVMSIAMHVLLGVGLWYISKPHPPKTYTGMATTLVTADMLDEIKKQAKSAQQNQGLPPATHAATEVSKDAPLEKNTPITPPLPTPTRTPKTNRESTTAAPVKEQPKATQRTEKQTPKPVKRQAEETKKSAQPEQKPIKKEPIFKPVAEAKPKLGKPDLEGMKKTEAWAKKQQAELDKMKKQKQAEDKLKKQAKDRERKANDAKKREKENALEKKKRDEAKKLKELKKKEKREAQAEKARREESKRVIEANRKRQQAQRDAANKQRRTASLADSKTKLGVDSAMDDEFNQIASGPSKAEINAAKNKYVGMIQRKIKRNWTKNTDKIITVPVRIRIDASGTVLSAVAKTSDAELRQGIQDAVYDSSPLPVPTDPAIFNKLFSKTVTLKFRTE